MPTALHYPLFTEYTLNELERHTIYSVGYLLAIRDGHKEANPTFRRRIAEQLRRSEAELFGEKAA